MSRDTHNPVKCPVLQSPEEAQAMDVAFKMCWHKEWSTFLWLYQADPHIANTELAGIWNLSTVPERRQILAEYVAQRLMR